MQVFVIGATGYIGGTVASALRDQGGHNTLAYCRRAEAQSALEMQGHTVVRPSADITSSIAEAATRSDGVVYTGPINTQENRDVVRAAISALAGSGKPFVMISGSAVVADMSPGEASNTVYSEDTAFTPHATMVERANFEQEVITAASQNIRTSVIRAPMVYGKNGSMLVPLLIRTAKNAGYSPYVGPGDNRWSYVHVNDLASLFVAALDKSPAGVLYHAAAGEARMRDIASYVAELTGSPSRSITPGEAAELWGETIATKVVATNSRTTGTRAQRLLGWHPLAADLRDEILRGTYANSFNNSVLRN